MEKSFKWNPKFCLVGSEKTNTSSECLVDWWSIHHFYWQGFFFIIFHYLLKIKNLKGSIILAIVLTILHLIDEYYSNIGMFSIEGVFVDTLGPLVDKKININLRTPDNDYLDNSIGDVLSGLFSCILIILYLRAFKKLPYFYLLFSILILFMLYTQKHLLYDKKELDDKNKD